MSVSCTASCRCRNSGFSPASELHNRLINMKIGKQNWKRFPANGCTKHNTEPQETRKSKATQLLQKFITLRLLSSKHWTGKRGWEEFTVKNYPLPPLQENTNKQMYQVQDLAWKVADADAQGKPANAWESNPDGTCSHREGKCHKRLWSQHKSISFFTQRNYKETVKQRIVSLKW